MWHTWTLDPLATGGLLVATWNYTKLIPYFEKDSKEYEFEVMLDWITSSFDLWEEVKFLCHEKQEYFKKNLKLIDINKILKNNFTWKITQISPKYSALKINWVRAYKLARSGEVVDIKEREVEILEIEILSFEYPKLNLRAKVSAGTYIRSIANDLWKILWTGGYISKLRRTQIWNLNISEATPLDDILVENNLQVYKMFSKTIFIELDDLTLEKINKWLKIKWNFDFPENINLFVYDGKNITNIVIYNWEYIKPVRKI
jgi:tRNA pseudouridine55 synthase